MSIRTVLAVALGIAVLAAGAAAHAQSKPEYIPFKPRVTKGVLYRPDSGPAPHIAVLIMHRTGNVLEHSATKELSKRGFMVLAMNPRFDNNEGAVKFERIIYDLRTGIKFLKKQKGITKIVLFGHSGGGPTMTLYQAVAENGATYCQGANKLSTCKDDVDGVPKADGVILADAHPGNPVMRLRRLNPAVLDEANAAKLDPKLNPFNRANGYSPRGDSRYSKAFQARYFKAQSDRMNRLIAKAQKIQADIKAGRHFPKGNDIFVIHRLNSRLMELDPSIYCCTVKPRKLLKNDGTIDSSRVIRTLRQPRRRHARRDARFWGGTYNGTIKSFLSAGAIKSTSSMDGIDWCSSNNSTPCAVQHISVPLLVAAMGGYYFIRDNEIHFELAKSADKDFIVVEGAGHGMRRCRSCTRATGKDYSNARKNFFDYVAKWLNARY
jgi:pimeloyl-ACP methyl ester carboxylesterase